MTSAVYADKIFSDVSSPGMRKKAMSVPSASFNESYIERLVRAELAKKPRANFTWLRIYGDKGGAPLPKPPDGLHTTIGIACMTSRRKHPMKWPR
jgi:hypothetical protein